MGRVTPKADFFQHTFVLRGVMDFFKLERAITAVAGPPDDTWWMKVHVASKPNYSISVTFRKSKVPESAITMMVLKWSADDR